MPPTGANPANRPLFAYGTLSDPQLLMRLLARPVTAATLIPASAPGWRAAQLAGKPWPVLVRAPGRAASGVLVMGLSPFERDLLDAYEGAGYKRSPVAVMVDVELFEADAYLPALAPPPDAPDWQLAEWQMNHKPRALVSEGAEADRLREKLIAIRPH
jgi:hypothetical protein